MHYELLGAFILRIHVYVEPHQYLLKLSSFLYVSSSQTKVFPPNLMWWNLMLVFFMYIWYIHLFLKVTISLYTQCVPYNEYLYISVSIVSYYFLLFTCFDQIYC